MSDLRNLAELMADYNVNDFTDLLGLCKNDELDKQHLIQAFFTATFDSASIGMDIVSNSAAKESNTTAREYLDKPEITAALLNLRKSKDPLEASFVYFVETYIMVSFMSAALAELDVRFKVLERQPQLYTEKTMAN